MSDYLIRLILTCPVILIALTVHEVSHGFAAYRLGDETAKYSGRLSLNPLKHLDPIGTLSLLILGYGWAKPVPVNPYFFKNRKSGMAIVAFAGPFSNFLLAIVFAFVYKLSAVALSGLGMLGLYASLFLQLGILINVSLGVFNLIPIPPLDGSKILMAVLPDSARVFMNQMENYGMLVMMLLLFTGLLDKPLDFMRNGVLQLIYFITGL